MTEAAPIRYLYDAGNHLELIVCGNSAISYPLHNHISVYTIGMVLDGAIQLHINQTARVYRKNQTFLIPPYVPHSIRADGAYSLLSLCVHKNLLPDLKNDMDRINAAILNLLTGAFGSNNIEQGQLSALFSRLDSLNGLPSTSFAAVNDPCMDALKRRLELFPENKFSVDEMARAALTSKYAFIRRFKQTVGLTPHQFQLQNRIRKAQRLISGADTLTEVALNTGFCDQSHFIKQFEKMVGLTPSTYKRSASICGLIPAVSRAPE